MTTQGGVECTPLENVEPRLCISGSQFSAEATYEIVHTHACAYFPFNTNTHTFLFIHLAGPRLICHDNDKLK